MYCSKCGKPLPDNAKFCPDCGTKTNTASLDASMPKNRKGGVLGKLILAVIICVGCLFGYTLFSGGSNQSADTRLNPITEHKQETNTQPQGDVSQGIEQMEIKPQDTTPQEDVSQGIEQMDVPAPQTNDETGQGTWEEDLMPQSLEYLTAVIWDDFIYPERLLEQGLPSKAEKVELYYAGGAWKYELIYPEADYREIGAATLMFGQYGAEWDFYPSQSLWGNEVSNTSREEVGYETFTGAIDGEVYSLRGNNSTLLLGPFVRIEGTEFGFGSLAADGGFVGTVLLTRP